MNGYTCPLGLGAGGQEAGRRTGLHPSKTCLGSEQLKSNAGPPEVWGALEGATSWPGHVFESEHICTWERMCVCISVHVSRCLCVASPCWAGSATWLVCILGACPCPLACCTLGSPPSNPVFTKVLTSLSPQGFIFAEEGSSVFPDTPTMHCKIPGGGLGVPGGAGQSLVGLLLSDGTVRQGLDTSRQGTGVGEGKEEKEKGGRETRL